jgi:hypothetical protein
LRFALPGVIPCRNAARFPDRSAATRADRPALPITGLIIGLMLIVASSYRQTIKAYPQGGGSYRVSLDNLGRIPGLVAGASLSIDDVLTVAVSVAAGIAALTSYLPSLEPLRVPLCLVALLLVMVANLRGVISSARLLSLPTFLFICMVLLLLATGAVRGLSGGLTQLNTAEQSQLPDVRLEVLDSPYRSLVDPVVAFVQRFEEEHRKDRNRFCMIVLPVFVTQHRWENLLHNQSTILLRQALREQGNRVVTTVGFYL